MTFSRSFAKAYVPTAMLVLITLFWGMGFSWAKNAGEAVNRAAGMPGSAAVGHLTQLAIRFSVAAIVWAAVVPATWRGWTWRTVRRGGTVGVSLSIGLILQHVGLGLSDEAVIAFLTNLTVIFVPAWVLLAGRQRPRLSVVLAVPVALAGMSLMSGIGLNGLSGGAVGGLWGTACAAAFAAEILLLDRLAKGESASRITLLLFLTAAVSCWAVAVTLPGFAAIDWSKLVSRGFLSDMGPSVIFTTIGAFPLMTIYQPRVDPSRAAVIYLCEPLFAAVFAWWLNGRTMTGGAVGGAALILLANVIAERPGRRV